MKKESGFTLIELLVVIAIIGVLASVILASLNTARAKARDAKRAQDIDQIYTALNLYYDTYGCLPQTRSNACGPAQGTYAGGDKGGWDYSSQGDFMEFLVAAGLMPSVPVDPINDMTGDGTAGQYSYRYYCYRVGERAGPLGGLHLGYWTETGKYVEKNGDSTVSWTDPSYSCK